MNRTPARRRIDLVRMANETMIERGLAPEFSTAVAAQLALIDGPGREAGAQIRDLRDLCPGGRGPCLEGHRPAWKARSGNGAAR